MVRYRYVRRDTIAIDSAHAVRKSRLLRLYSCPAQAPCRAQARWSGGRGGSADADGRPVVGHAGSNAYGNTRAVAHSAPGTCQSDSIVVDILPGLKARDSYGAQGRHRAAPESLRRVPAAGGITAPLTSQANRACPVLNGGVCRAPGQIPPVLSLLFAANCTVGNAIFERFIRMHWFIRYSRQ